MNNGGARADGAREAHGAAQALGGSGSPRIARGPMISPMIGAIGIVFGDIGTSPLYTMKTVLQLAGGSTSAEAAIGVLSLLLWTLFIITTVKYVNIAMRIDNDGEGGILALMALLGTKVHKRPSIVAIGLFGAALIYGDGTITPAISVLSALEGLNTAMPALQPYVLLLSVVILAMLFMLQPVGTARIGRAFGPVMLAWFGVVAALGVYGLVLYPGVLVALNPLHGLHFLIEHGLRGFLMLGGVFLCVTGAEALYADMGHFGAGPIRASWSWIVFPALILNYAGQAALLVAGRHVGDNIFYALCPPMLLLPVIVLAALATIIASQSIITGAFSMTRQAILLGWLPRLKVQQTSSTGYGQIYVGAVNWLMMVATIGLALIFRKSDNLAAAYGIAVSLTMLMTSCLLFLAMREIWRWSLVRAAVIAGFLLVIDSAFFAANSMKLLEGGYAPLLLAMAIYGVMWSWHRGTLAVGRVLDERLTPAADLLAMLKAAHVPRVTGTAVFLTRTTTDIPSVLRWHVLQNKALHESVLILRVEVAQVPWLADATRLSITALGPSLWRGVARYGFMERPDIPGLMIGCAGLGCPIDPADVTYYLGHETLVAGNSAPWLFRLVRPLYMAMARNSEKITDYLRLPTDRVVEIGRTVEI